MVLHAAIVAEERWLLASADEARPGLDAWRARILDPRGVCRVVRQGPRVLGWAQILPGPYRRVAHVGHLEIYLAAEVRGAGLGERLLRGALEGAAAHPLLKKVSLAVRADNERAIVLYRRAGFVEEGRRRGELRDGDQLVDDLLMATWVKPIS